MNESESSEADHLVDIVRLCGNRGFVRFKNHHCSCAYSVSFLGGGTGLGLAAACHGSARIIGPIVSHPCPAGLDTRRSNSIRRPPNGDYWAGDTPVLARLENCPNSPALHESHMGCSMVPGRY